VTTYFYLLAVCIAHACPGPLYDPTTGFLHFVDINQKRVYHCDTVTLALSFDQFEEAVTALAFRREGKGVSIAVRRQRPKSH
jgi:hypothetical protein